MDISLLLVCIVLCVMQSSKCAEDGEKCRYGLQNVFVTQTITNKGFHRDVITNIEWTGQDNCTLLLQQSIPRGMVVDLDQVNTFSKQFKIRSVSKVDVETPAHKASTQVLWIYPTQQQYSHTRKDHSLSITFPVHLRYHKASHLGNTFERVTLGQPRIHVKCHREAIQDNCKVVSAACHATGGSMCKWIDITQVPKDVISVMVPVGDLNHRPAVTIVTLLCAMIGTLWTLSVTVKY